ncbi:MAG TPA: hypothetical protein VER96_17905 [Polyangiaceae bacterium]|nr:hypothetical protein [Polyangiaceae bacterium]
MQKFGCTAAVGALFLLVACGRTGTDGGLEAAGGGEGGSKLTTAGSGSNSPTHDVSGGSAGAPARESSGGGETIGGASNVAGAGGTGSSIAGSPETGEAGAGGIAERLCRASCNVDADCNRPPHSADTCDTRTKTCVGAPCDVDADCAPWASLWVPGCTSDADCDSTLAEICVVSHSDGYCAELADPPLGCFRSTNVTVEWPRFGIDAEAAVCGSRQAICTAHRCAWPCDATSACPDSGVASELPKCE